MLTVTASQARKEWSNVVDTVVRDKPILIRSTRNRVLMANVDILDDLLCEYAFHADLYSEDDGTVTASLHEIDLAETGIDEKDVKVKLAESILDYANDYYEDFSYWSRGNRKAHIPYVFKALMLGDVEKIGEAITCRLGEI